MSLVDEKRQRVHDVSTRDRETRTGCGGKAGSDPLPRDGAHGLNVYLDSVEPLGDDRENDDGKPRPRGEQRSTPHPGWPGEPTPKSELHADELFEKLKPFKDLVEKDIEAEREKDIEADR